MKRVILSLFVIAGMTAMADHPDHIKADGHAMWKSGKDLTKKAVSMYVPKDGKGKVYLEVDGKEVEAKSVNLVKLPNRTIATVAFENVPGAPKDAVYLLKGTLLSGDNGSIYYGDFFTQKAPAVAKAGCATCDDECCEDCTCKDCKCCDGGTCDPGCECCKGCKGGCKGGACPADHKGGGAKKFVARAAAWQYMGAFGFHTKMAK